MSKQRARNAAESMVKDLGIQRPPVDVEAVARALGLQVHRDVLEAGVSGALVKTPSGNKIVVNALDAVVRQRFSVAHEIGHHRLAHRFPKGENVHVDRGHFLRRDGKSSQGVDPQEIEANQFASALLMPASLLETVIDASFTGPLDDADVSELARRFQVSEQAMTLRLTALGYV